MPASHCTWRTSASTLRKHENRRSSVSWETGAELLQAFEERDPSLRDRLDQVAVLARAAAERLGLSGAELDELTRAAQLHDVGKVAVPDSVLEKAGPLDAIEWEFLRQHTIVGERILNAAPSLTSVAKLVRSSHERYDGRGYPGREIRKRDPARVEDHRRLRCLPCDDLEPPVRSLDDRR